MYNRENMVGGTPEEKKLHRIITTTKPEVSLNKKHGKIYSSSGHRAGRQPKNWNQVEHSLVVGT